MRAALFFLGLVFSLTPWATPPIALAIGAVLALAIGNPFARQTSKTTKYLLQISVVGLGFGMNLQQVIAAGKRGLLFTIATIAGTLILGFLAGRALRVTPTLSHLISSGTAICGGSAIAAVGPVVGATDEEMSVSLGTVFILNAIALFVFPVLGRSIGLTQTQFGILVGDRDSRYELGCRCSVALRSAGAAGSDAGQACASAVDHPAHARHRGSVPAQIGEGDHSMVHLPFVLASIIRTYTPADPALWNGITAVARQGLTVTLFLIGAGLSRAAIAAVGVRPLVLGVLLWLAISATSLYAVITAL